MAKPPKNVEMTLFVTQSAKYPKDATTVPRVTIDAKPVFTEMLRHLNEDEVRHLDLLEGEMVIAITEYYQFLRNPEAVVIGTDCKEY